MNLDERIKAFKELGKILRNPEEYPEKLRFAIQRSQHINGWFTEQFVQDALVSIGESLNESDLNKWITNYPKLKEKQSRKTTGVIMAGNIPAVGFHDFLCVVMAGNKFIGKTSSTDPLLLPVIADLLIDANPQVKELIAFTDGRLDSIEQIIATGSNNSSRYFEHYFAKYPNIIRKNRNSAAILSGDESNEDLNKLGKDIFQYFGLGCRNVSKLFVPKDYEFRKFFEGIFEYSWVLNNNKYSNNYDYNKTLYLMNKELLWENGFVILKEDIGLASPIATLYYEYYNSEEEVIERLNMDKPYLQCLVSKNDLPGSIRFGETQKPKLWEYADNVDTMKFLLDN